LRRTEGRTRNERNRSRQVAHSSLDEFFNSRPLGDFFGDDSRQQDPGVTRVLFQNVHGINAQRLDQKQRGLFKCWKDERVGIALLAEMNLHWPSLRQGHSWYDRVKKFATEGHFSSVAYYRHQEIPSPSGFQWGGCSATLLNKVSHRAKSAGEDESGLGRFSWIKLRGRDRQDTEGATGTVEQRGPRDLVVIAAYRPNKAGPNAGSVWTHQRNYWLDQGVSTDPREKFTEDVLSLVAQWKTDGCEIILAVDANEDVSANSPTSFRQQMATAGLTEAILRRHHGTYPATQQMNMSSTPIDGIFVSDAVKVTASGYIDFQQYFNSIARSLGPHVVIPHTGPGKERGPN